MYVLENAQQQHLIKLTYYDFVSVFSRGFWIWLVYMVSDYDWYLPADSIQSEKFVTMSGNL